MKRTVMFAAVLAAAILLFSCDTGTGDPGESGEKYKDLYNYPDGRKNPSGTLEIRNSMASKVLLFTDSLSPANYVGTVESLSTIRVKLPEQKFYTIVAVDKATWEERGDQAAQFSDLTYYSNTQPYSMTVHTSDTYGGGDWIINNNTNYWVSFKKSDGSGIIYAVAAPNAKRVKVPVQLNVTYDYVPHYYKELKYNGVVIALVESDELSAADTVITTEANKQFHTDIGTDIKPPSTNIKPAIFFTNSSDKTVRMFSGQNNQLSNGAVTGNDFALASGISQLFTGLEAGTNTNSINFSSIAWTDRVYVTQNITMQINKVYRIVLNGKATPYSTTVEEEDADEYFK
jgi:hypothetical protein